MKIQSVHNCLLVEIYRTNLKHSTQSMKVEECLIIQSLEETKFNDWSDSNSYVPTETTAKHYPPTQNIPGSFKITQQLHTNTSESGAKISLSVHLEDRFISPSSSSSSSGSHISGDALTTTTDAIPPNQSQNPCERPTSGLAFGLSCNDDDTTCGAVRWVPNNYNLLPRKCSAIFINQ